MLLLGGDRWEAVSPAPPVPTLKRGSRLARSLGAAARGARPAEGAGQRPVRGGPPGQVEGAVRRRRQDHQGGLHVRGRVLPGGADHDVSFSRREAG